jgi:hypothetical protein
MAMVVFTKMTGCALQGLQNLGTGGTTQRNVLKIDAGCLTTMATTQFDLKS